VKAGDLRRFHDDAFFANEKSFNGKFFVPLEWWTPHVIDILVDGEINHSWSYRILVDNSDPVNETR
jgi:hypothetical protein